MLKMSRTDKNHWISRRGRLLLEHRAPHRIARFIRRVLRSIPSIGGRITGVDPALQMLNEINHVDFVLRRGLGHFVHSARKMARWRHHINQVYFRNWRCFFLVADWQQHPWVACLVTAVLAKIDSKSTHKTLTGNDDPWKHSTDDRSWMDPIELWTSTILNQ